MHKKASFLAIDVILRTIVTVKVNHVNLFNVREWKSQTITKKKHFDDQLTTEHDERKKRMRMTLICLSVAKSSFYMDKQ